MAKWTLVLPLLIWGCGGRTLTSTPDGAVQLDIAVAADADAGADRGHVDTLVPPPDGMIVYDDAGPLAFCSGGKPKAFLDNKPLAVTGHTSGLGVMASCCPPGEFVTLEAMSGSTKVALTLEILRFIGTPAPPPKITINLAQPPKGWLVDVRCTPYQACGLLRPDNATFQGTLEMTSLLGGPAYQVSLCLKAQPKPSTPPNPSARPVKLYFDKIMVNTACAIGMDQTCNADPKVSTLLGKCNPDSTCTCIPNAKKTPNGKCM
jgi:hypothetical protein